MYVKRLVAPLCAVVVLLVVAGVLETLILMFPAQSKAVAAVEQTAVRSVIELVNLVADEPSRAGYVDEAAELARQLQESGSIVVDGLPLDQTHAEGLVAARGDYTSRVDYIDQKPVLASGCEVIALTVALRAEGLDADPREIADGHLRMGKDASLDYLGSPDKNGGGLPPCIVDAANSWLAAHGHAARAHDLTGSSFEGVRALVEMGYPVAAWVTEGLVEPRGIDGGSWYYPEHCVVVYGFEGADVLVSDSLEGLVHRDAAEFANVYGACGSHSLIVG